MTPKDFLKSGKTAIGKDVGFTEAQWEVIHGWMTAYAEYRQVRIEELKGDIYNAEQEISKCERLLREMGVDPDE